MTLETGVKELAVAVGADVKALDRGKVDKVAGKSLISDSEVTRLANMQTYTLAEKNKLAGLESSRFKGVFPSLGSLKAGVISPQAGDYADVDSVGVDVMRYIYDATDSVWVVQQAATSFTAAQAKQLYESNPDTNAFDDDSKRTLDDLPLALNAKVDKVAGYSLVDDAEIAKLLTVQENATANRADSLNADKVHTHTISDVAGLSARLSDIGNLSQLLTDEKRNLVAAINETIVFTMGNIDGGVVAVDSIADLLSLPEEYRRDDLRYLVKSYHPPQDYLDQPYSGGGLFSYDPERSLENDGGMILNGFVRNITERHPTIGPEFFGARYDLSETLVPVDYMSDRPEHRVRITSQTFEAECVNKCIRWARARPDLLVNVKISGFIKVYAYLEPLDFDIKISGSSPQTSGFQSMDTSPTDASGYGIITCGKPRDTGSNFVWIENIKLDGRGSFRLKPDMERRVYNLATYTGSNLYAHNIESVDSPIDCLNVSGETAYVVNSIFKGSYRNSLTCGSVSKWAKFIDCEISEAGYVHGGTNPRYCVDVEPNVATKPAELVEFTRCKLSKARNSLVGAVWSTTVWGDCVFDGSERAPEVETSRSPWLGAWSQGNHLITGCQFIGNSERHNTVHGLNVNHENSDLGYDSRLVFKDNLFKGCGMHLSGFNIEAIGNRFENSRRGIQALRPNNIDVQRFVIKDNYLYNVIPTATGEIAAIQVQAAVAGEVLVEGNTVVFDRNELEWVDGVILEQLKIIQAFQVDKPSSGTASGTRIILNNTAINYYKEYIEGLIPLTETATVKGWPRSIADSPIESWPPMPNDPAFYRGNL